MHPVVQDQEREAEDGKSVVGPQFAVLHVDVELLRETADRQHREVPAGRVDVGQVVTRLVQVTAAGQDQAPAGTRPRQQRRGEAGLRHGEAHADVAAAAVPVGGVDADVDRLIGVGERPDPAADRRAPVPGAGQRDRVDPAADAPLGLALVHRHVGLPQRAGDQGPVEQVTRPHPQPPLRDDVEGEPGGVLVELADQRVGARRVEVRAGQVVHRGDDAHIRRVGGITSAEFPGQFADVAGADVPGPGFAGHDERHVLRRDPLREQADLRVPEHRRGRDPVGRHRGGGHHGRGHRPPPRSQCPAHRGAEQRPEQHLLRADPQQATEGPGGRAHLDGLEAGQPASRPPQRGDERGAGRDPRPQRRDLPRALPGPCHRLRRGQHRGPGGRAQAGGPRAPVSGERRPGHAADDTGREDLVPPLRRCARLLRCHAHQRYWAGGRASGRGDGEVPEEELAVVAAQSHPPRGQDGIDAAPRTRAGQDLPAADRQRDADSLERTIPARLSPAGSRSGVRWPQPGPVSANAVLSVHVRGGGTER